MQFKDHLEEKGIPLTARFIQGLVYSCHERWSPAFATSEIAVWVLEAIQEYEGANLLLRRWKDAAEMILGAHGHAAFAELLVETEKKIDEFCEAWRVSETSAYTRDAIEFASTYCRDHATPSPYFLEELLPWSLWPLENFKSEISKTILSATEKGPSFVEALQRFVRGDERLLDPRLPRNAKNWTGISDTARLLFIQWLSREDIKFFFDHVLPKGHDPHGRKNFWLLYEGRIHKSRPLLNPKDEARLRLIPWQSRTAIGNFGRIKGATSAFLLDFGSILVIEFSETGNACHVYERLHVESVVPEFWATRPFVSLKRPEICIERIVHRDGWQEEMAALLARYGIREESSR